MSKESAAVEGGAKRRRPMLGVVDCRVRQSVRMWNGRCDLKDTDVVDDGWWVDAAGSKKSSQMKMKEERKRLKRGDRRSSWLSISYTAAVLAVI